MYTHCMFCTRDLGRNEALETFSVGKRIAFDAVRGRLWVVCRVCERWNLVPLEERWEAVEECERTFEGLRLRVSTAHVGLARHPAGVSLVRIGEPLRPEFAAWRYGDQFGRRRRTKLMWGGVGVVLVSGLVVGSYMTGAGFGVIYTVTKTYDYWKRHRTRARLPLDAHHAVLFRDIDLARAMVGWGKGGMELCLRRGEESWSLSGAKARRLASLVLPAVNREGGTAAQVREAVSAIEEAGHPERFLTGVFTRPVGSGSVGDDPRDGGSGATTLSGMPIAVRLAAEMALHEEDERRALEGELAGLEAMWRRAEELAAISDDLLLPAGTEEFIERHRSEGG